MKMYRSISSSYLAIQNQSQAIFVIGGHLGEKRALSQQHEGEESVIEAEGDHQMQSHHHRGGGGGGGGRGPWEPKSKEGEDEERSAVQNGFATDAENTAKMNGHWAKDGGALRWNEIKKKMFSDTSVRIGQGGDRW